MAYFHTTVLDNQIKALPTVDTASSSVANFNTDMTENLVEVKCQIVAKQASGTPSPDNPLPITTYTEMNVSARGKNLIDQTKYYQLNANIVVIGQTVSNTNRLVYLRQGTYTIKVETSNQATIYYDYGNGSTSLGNTSDKRTFTLANDSYCAFWLYKSGGYSPSDITTIQLEQGNEATTYVPFNGTTANIPFGQTVANGVLDISTGKLRVTHQIVETTWGNFVNKTVLTNYTRGQLNITSFGIGINTNPSDICNVAPFKANYSSDDCHFYVAVSGSFTNVNIFLPNDTSNDTAIQIVYELATPQEIQLDSITLQALLNENNVWCDTGDTEVKFLLSVGKKIA